MHIDASLLRVVVDLTDQPEGLDITAGGALGHLLQGRLEPSTFSTEPELERAEIGLAVVLSHEHRHYVDHFLTNFGAWVARFWTQLKSITPVALRRTPLVPVQYLFDDVVRDGFGVPDPARLDESVRKAAVLAWNHSAVIRKDAIPGQDRFGGLSGAAQMEALATAFEIAPLEALEDSPSWDVIASSVTRDRDRWQQGYVWPALLFDHFGIGPGTATVRLASVAAGPDVETRVAFTRLWPTFLVAALMGDFRRWRLSDLDADPGLESRILPAFRLAQLLMWAERRDLRDVEDPIEAWPVVQEACQELFGSSVVESMEAEIDWMEGALPDPPEEAMEWNAWSELTFLVRQRRRVLEQLKADPMSLLDPIRAPASDFTLVPDFMLFHGRGFDEIPPGLEPLAGYLFGGDGPPLLLRPTPQDDFQRGFQDQDELWTALARFMTRGHLADAWLGPELDVVADLVAERGVPIVPPHDRRPLEFAPR